MIQKSKWALKLALCAILPLALIAGGLFLSKLPNAHNSDVSAQLAPQTPFTPEPEVYRGKPVRIVVANRYIDLPVIDGSYNAETGEWTLTDDKAQFATNSSLANNQGGNTFIYGHDIPQVFRRLASLQVGDTAEVVTDNNYRFVYRYRSSVDVSPSNTSIFSYSGAPILTLQTCSGAWSQYRHLMTFDLVEVTKV